MQFRMSPGGITPSSSRSRPELPPSSVTVTMTERAAGPFLRPRSNVDKPVPPPMETILGVDNFNGLLFRRRDQFSKFRLVRYRLKVMILSRLKPILGSMMNRLPQIRYSLVLVS